MFAAKPKVISSIPRPSLCWQKRTDSNELSSNLDICTVNTCRHKHTCAQSLLKSRGWEVGQVSFKCKHLQVLVSTTLTNQITSAENRKVKNKFLILLQINKEGNMT